LWVGRGVEKREYGEEEPQKKKIILKGENRRVSERDVGVDGGTRKKYFQESKFC